VKFLINFFFLISKLNEKKEQVKEDLKGLEETVVRFKYPAFPEFVCPSSLLA